MTKYHFQYYIADCMLNFATQRLNDTLDYPKVTEGLLESIEAANHDVLFLAQAYNPLAAIPGDRIDAFEWNLAGLGYKSLYFGYNDPDGRRDQHGGWLAVKQDLLRVGWPNGGAPRLAGRCAVWLSVTDRHTGQDIGVMAAHLDDRSSERRFKMLDDLWPILDEGPERVAGRWVLMGPMNSIERDDPHAKVLRRVDALRRSGVVREIWDKLIATPGEVPERGLRRILSLAARGSDMATDGVADTLRALNLVSVDPAYTPTARSGGLALRLTDIRYAESRLHVVDYGVEPPHPGMATGRGNYLQADSKVWAYLRPILQQ